MTWTPLVFQSSGRVWGGAGAEEEEEEEGSAIRASFGKRWETRVEREVGRRATYIVRRKTLSGVYMSSWSYYGYCCVPSLRPRQRGWSRTRDIRS